MSPARQPDALPLGQTGSRKLAMLKGRQIDSSSGSHTLVTGPRKGPMGNVRWQNMTYKSSKPQAPLSHSLRSPVRAVGTWSMNWLKTKAQDETDGVGGDLPCVHAFGWRHPWAQSEGKAETGERFKIQDHFIISSEKLKRGWTVIQTQKGSNERLFILTRTHVCQLSGKSPLSSL